MPDVDATPLPAPVDSLHLYALLARVQRARLAAGALRSERAIYDVRPFKDALAELAYLRRLAAAGKHGGTILTSMAQLVAGFAEIHPGWDMSGDRFQARDRHQQTVREHLRTLTEMGVLRTRVGVDLDGEERRTELELCPAPDVDVDELAGAGEALKRRQRRYGRALNTGSRSGVTNALVRAKPLTAAERQRRGCVRTRAVGAHRRRGDQSVSAPPFGASASLQDNTSGNPTADFSDNEPPRTGVHTRTSARVSPNDGSALEPHQSTHQSDVVRREGAGEGAGATGGTRRGPSEGAGGVAWDPAALAARVEALQAQRAAVLARIAEQAQRRALEVAEWTMEREWPAVRLREAWVVARWGASTAADSGPAAAGPLSHEHYVRLRRAVARWERNAAAAPDGWPTGGLAALLHLGAVSALGELHDGPRLLCWAIGRLDQLSRRLRALASANSAAHQAHAAGRAHRRREGAPTPSTPGGLRLTFRGLAPTRASWPPLLLLDGQREPKFSPSGELLLNPRLVDAGLMNNPGLTTRLAIRDAYLLAGRRLPMALDGRAMMAARHRGHVERAVRPQQIPLEESELRELAHLTGERVALLRRLSPAYRQAWLTQLRQEQAARSAAETRTLKDAIARGSA